MNFVTHGKSKSKILKQDDYYFDDRISELPDEILFHILSYLPYKNIVITSPLSTRWKSLWTNFFSVDFDFDYSEREPRKRPIIPADSIQGEVQKVPHNGRIRKFGLKIPSLGSTIIISEWKAMILSLLSEVLRYKVEELDCSLPCNWRYMKMMPLPDSLFTSDSLTSLKLDMNARLNFPISTCFPRLKTLHLREVKFQGKHHPENFFSACLVLEELVLQYCTWNYSKGVTLSNATLKKLIVFIYNNYLLLEIYSSNLQSLTLSCSDFDVKLCNPSSLVEADITINPGMYGEQICLPHRVLKLLERIRHVKSLKLSTYTLKTISSPENFTVDNLPEFFNLTHLRVGNEYFNRCEGNMIPILMDILQKSPNLQSLELYKGLRLSIIAPLDDGFLLKNDVPICLKCSLKTFSISEFEGSEQEVRLLRYVLQNADALEHFTVHWSSNLARESERKMSIEQDISRFLNPNCENLFL